MVVVGGTTQNRYASYTVRLKVVSAVKIKQGKGRVVAAVEVVVLSRIVGKDLLEMMTFRQRLE